MKWLVFAGRRSPDLGMVPGIRVGGGSSSSPPPPPARSSSSSGAINSLFESRVRGYIANIQALEWHG